MTRSPKPRSSRPTIWRLILGAGVAAMIGFVGGAWFISSGLGFEWIQPPQTLPAPTTVVRATRGVRPVAPTKVAAIEVPPARDFSGGSAGLLPRTSRIDLLPSPGCSWEVEPRPFQPEEDGHQTQGESALVGMPLVDPKSGRLRYALVQSPRRADSAAALRMVLFDQAAHRYPAQTTGQSTSQSADSFYQITKFAWNEGLPTPASEAAYFGVERVVTEASQASIAAVQAEAQSRQVAILPPPRLGEPFRFDLPTTTAGHRVRSAELPGKVVLIAIWGPGLRIMGPIRAVISEFSSEDLAIIGVSFDPTMEEATTIFERLVDRGTLVHIPNDRDNRRLWIEGASITQLPLYWLLDRKGVLRYQSTYVDIPTNIKILLSSPSQ